MATEIIARRVLADIQKHHMLERGGKVILGLSGGADSVALLHVLLALRPLLAPAVTCVHIHHGLRGASADADERFCQVLCERLAVPFISRRVDVALYAAENGLSVEEAGRMLRYAVFEEIRQSENAQKIAVAHHLNDQAETILMRLVRGTGAAGLAGIPPVRGVIIRPMLGIPRAEIEAYCAANGIAYRTDETNADERYTRNKIRHALLPLIEREMNPSALWTLARMASLAAEENEALERFAEQAFAACVSNDTIHIPQLSAQPPAIRRRIVRRVLAERVGLKDLHFVHVDDILSLAVGQTGKSVQLPGGFSVEHVYNELRFVQGEGRRESFSYTLSLGGSVRVPELGLTFALAAVENAEKNAAKLCTKWIDCDKMDGTVQIRRRQPGDLIVVNGHTKKLKKYWIDNRTPREARESSVLLADGANVIWIVGGALSAKYAAHEDTLNRAVIEVWED